MTGVHIKSINVQDMSIQRSLNLVRLPVPVEKDPAVYVRYSTVYDRVILLAAVLLTLFAVGTYIHIYVQNCMYALMCVHAYTLGLCPTLESGIANAYTSHYLR